MYSVREISDCVRGPSRAHSSSPQSQPPSQEHPVGYTDTCLWYPHQGSKQNLVWERSTEGRGSEGGRASFLSVIISLHLRGHMSQCFSCVSVTPFPVILSHCSRCHWILPRPPLPGRCTQSLATGSYLLSTAHSCIFLKGILLSWWEPPYKWLASYSLALQPMTKEYRVKRQLPCLRVGYLCGGAFHIP